MFQFLTLPATSQRCLPAHGDRLKDCFFIYNCNSAPFFITVAFLFCNFENFANVWILSKYFSTDFTASFLPQLWILFVSWISLHSSNCEWQNTKWIAWYLPANKNTNLSIGWKTESRSLCWHLKNIPTSNSEILGIRMISPWKKKSMHYFNSIYKEKINLHPPRKSTRMISLLGLFRHTETSMSILMNAPLLGNWGHYVQGQSRKVTNRTTEEIQKWKKKKSNTSSPLSLFLYE